MHTATITFNGQPLPLGDINLGDYFPAVKAEDDFCPACFDQHGRGTCSWVINTRVWREEIELARMARSVKADESFAARKARESLVWDKKEAKAIKVSRRANPEAVQVEIIRGLKTSRPKGRNRDHAELKAQQHQMWLMGTRSFDLPITSTDIFLDEEDEFFAMMEAKVEKDATNMVRSIVGKVLRQEKILMTPAQAKRARKKANKLAKGTVVTNTPPKKPSKVKMVAKVVYVSTPKRATSDPTRPQRLAERKMKKEVFKASITTDQFFRFVKGIAEIPLGNMDIDRYMEVNERHGLDAWFASKEVK